MAQYKIWNGPFPTTAAQLAVTTGTSIKTMLQVKGVTAVQMKVKAWGVSMDGSAAAAGLQWELCETGTVFGTVTASVAADILGWDGQGLATTATTGNVLWQGSFERVGTAQDTDTDGFATAASFGAAACSATSGIIVITNGAFANGAAIDSIAVGDLCRFKIERLGSNGSDTMSGDAELMAVELKET